MHMYVHRRSVKQKYEGTQEKVSFMHVCCKHKRDIYTQDYVAQPELSIHAFI